MFVDCRAELCDVEMNMNALYLTFVFSIPYQQLILQRQQYQKEQSQTLRSALNEKARKAPSSGGSTKPKRKMKPGQAKTLSDLPQLSA